MPRTRRLPLFPVAVLAAASLVPLAAADTVVLNNGIVYRGTVDRDKPLLWVYDGLKRVVLRDSKVRLPIVSDATFSGLEVFKLEQPLLVHAGAMPKEVVAVKAGGWNEKGRRPFAYEGSRPGKVFRMEQAINEMGPYLVKIRGVDGFWQGQLATNQVPREVVMGILARVDQKDRNERIRVARFLIQAGWFAEARNELGRILKDFPDDADLRDRVGAARASVSQLAAVQVKVAIDRCRLARQPREAASLVKTFPFKDVNAELDAQVRELGRTDGAQAVSDKYLADDLKALAARLPTHAQADWKAPLLEVLGALREAPEAVRDRFNGWQKALADGRKPAESVQFALAMSGYVVGADAAVEDLSAARVLWTERDQVRDYLASRDEGARADLLGRLERSFGTEAAGSSPSGKLDTVTRLALRMPPPLHRDAEGPAADGAKIHRVADDENAEPTEYAVFLPPEYHPLRSYPAVVALHDGGGPQEAIHWWSGQAAKRGYIVIAPEYLMPDKGVEYHFSKGEHAAVELALRDARRRYAIDSDRVFVGGQLTGANMAWDFGLAHPDMFAGVVVISGLPFKYVNRYLVHTDRVPLYVAIGDLAPAANEVVYGAILKPLIAKAYDVTYTEYFRRGLEDLPEEAPAVFDWMDRKRRDPYPRKFEVVTARASDNRFFGVVIHEIQPGRAMPPEAVEPLGKNLNPATLKMTSSGVSNLLKFETSGLLRPDVWLSPKLIDFGKRIEVRINGRVFYKGPAKYDLEPLLEDLRLRGDRQQIYWMKLSAG